MVLYCKVNLKNTKTGYFWLNLRHYIKKFGRLEITDMILDVHSHRPTPYPQGVVCLMDCRLPLADGQAYSVGIHPWDTAAPLTEDVWVQFEQVASNPQVVAIGECGIDLTKGGAMFRQLQVFRRQVEISERLQKPLVIHCVKGADIIMGLKRDLNPKQYWVIHGFRGKPELARQLVSKGIFLSFGEKFNADTVMSMPPGMFLAETDESILTIEEIIGNLSVAANRDLLPEIEANTMHFLTPQ